MAKDAKGTEPWIDDLLGYLRAMGFRITQAPNGVWFRWPKHSTVWYGQQGVDGNLLDEIDNDLARFIGRLVKRYQAEQDGDSDG